MSVPSHGPDCVTTHVFPTRCSYCNEPVFFYACSCGSKVFFDELKTPWPKHICGSARSDEAWAKGRPKKKLESGEVRVEITDGVTAIRPAESEHQAWDINPDVVEKAKRDASSRESNPIDSIPPGEESQVEITGVVREIENSVDVCKKLNMPNTEISKALLGTLGSGKWGRVTIHEYKSVIHSYTAWVPNSMLSLNTLRKGITVTAVLQKHDVHTIAREWMCESFCVE